MPGGHVRPVRVKVALDAVRDALGEIEVGEGELVHLAVPGAEIRVAPRHVILEIGIRGDPDAARERLPATIDPPDQARRAEVVERVREGLPVAELVGELDRLLAPEGRGVGVPGQHPERGLGAVGHGELAPRRQRLQNVEGAAGCRVGLGVPPRVPVAARRPPRPPRRRGGRGPPPPLRGGARGPPGRSRVRGAPSRLG
jgi:hypothetical protein